MSSQSFSFRASPSVTSERWLKHAVHKMSRGYNLIVNKDRKVANFYKGFGDFESCSYQTARKLILHDFLELVGENDMGMEYRLKLDKDLDVTSSSDDADDPDDDETITISDSTHALDDELEGAADEEDEEEVKYDDDDEE